MTTRKLRILNRRFEEFGRQLDGRLNYRWMQTSEMQYVHKSGGYEPTLQPSGIYACVPNYRIHNFDKIYGKHWCIAKLDPPQSERDWRREFGETFPWERTGHYRPIDSTLIAANRDPNEKLTIYAIYLLRKHLSATIADHLIASRAEVYMEEVRMQKLADELVDENWFSFDHIPGGKGHVSFPSVQPTSPRRGSDALHLLSLAG